ncbi:DNA helicase [Pseudoclavibacter endophyticus]|uniref:DEAD/DEAH box helicase n=1 Tax=Pseudoclavibacter endophyticus TaxID=1778590 RepID=A0A6H9WIL8_9MICO|nr:DEAD/DEAH box helicase [Pseudoclavibacter endophyticus]KAB1648357.1 DEAD/DEAH box helicase [Pseudoclavibacter endophyticus]GGA71969.1 DNA helicase [Pseudoclavibacter endophyticus]
MTADGPSLTISLAAEVTRVRLIARVGLEDHLRRLAVGFQTSTQRSPSSIEIELDDLLTNLRALGGWPHQADGDVAWDAQLQALVVDSLQDAQTVSGQLASPGAPGAVDAESVPDALGPGWAGDLTAFQRRDIAKLLSLRHGANFSVPGAGKTRVGLAVFQALRRAEGLDRLLIVGPKSSYSAWLEENTECLRTPLLMEIADGAPASTTEALIVNYERLPNMVNALSRWLTERPSMIILDEAHRMKLGADGAYGAACLALGPRSRRRLILTGTPAPNGAKDLENLFGFVWPGTGRQSVIRAVNGGSLADASRVLRPLFTRTTKGELDLPPVETAIRTIPLPPLHAEIYEALVGQFSARAAGHEGDFHALGQILVYMLMAATSPALLAVGASRYEPLAYRVPPLPVPERSSLYQLMQDLPAYEMSPKYQEVLAIVSENAARGRKTLVWSTFIRSINTLERVLGRFSPAVVHGGTPDRDEQIRRFKRDDDCMVLLSNPATLGEGISLHHECHDAVYLDRDFAAGRFLQSLDRIHRLGLPPGTETRVTVLASERTIDEVVAARLADKLAFMGGILDDPAVQQLADLDEEPPIGGGLDRGDLQALMGHLRASST